MELFPVNSEDPLDFVSFLGYLGLLSDVVLSNMIDKQSACVKNAISQLFNHTLCEIINFYVKSIEVLETQNYLTINQKKVFAHQKWLFKVLLLNSLRHFKHINTEFTVLVKFMVNEIRVTEQATIHILRVLEIILKKNVSIIDESLANYILKTMNLVANAPIMGFKYHANNISRSIIKITTLDNIKNIQLLPIRGIDTNDLINNLQLELTPKTTPKILELFENNIDNRDGGFLYKKLLEKCDFEAWRTEVWPYFEPKLKNLEREGEFYQSLTKYWLPITVKHYNHQCLDLLNFDLQLKAQALYEIRKQGFYRSEHDQLLLMFVQNQDTSFLAVKIAATYTRKSWPPSPADLASVDYFLRGTVQELDEGVLRSLRHFFSHLLFFGHRSLSKSSIVGLRAIQRFFWGLRRFLDEIFEVNGEVYAQILKVYLDLSKGSSRDLHLLYKLEERDHYGKGGNLFAQNFEVSKIGFIGGCNMSKLIVGHFLDVVSEEEVLDCLRKLSKDLNLQSLEFVGNCAQILCLKGCGSVFEVSQSIFCVNDEFSLEETLFLQTLQLQCLLVDLQSGKNIKGCQEVLEVFLEQFLGNFEVYKEGGDKMLKISEAFINNILSCLMLKLPENVDLLLEHLCFIIRASNMRKPVTLAVKLMTILPKNVKFLGKILGNILESPNELNITIRRNPESRLIIHSFCSQKFLLPWCMDFLLSILKICEETTDSSVSSALHCIELLISDNNLHLETLSYIPKIIKNSVILFQKKHWRVRNGVLQVVKALIERFLGVSLSQSSRPKTVEDLFLLFDLQEFFYSFLINKNLNDSMIIVSLFFCESQFKTRPFEDKLLDHWKFKFKAAFFKITQNYFGYYSHLAILSIVAMTTTEEIPNLFQDLVQYLTKNPIKSNTLWNFVKILQLLHQKLTKTDLNLEILEETLSKYPKDLQNLFFKKPQIFQSSKEVLVQKLLYTEDSNYLKSCYFQNFLELSNQIPFKPNFRKTYKTLEKYKILTLVVLLGNQHPKNEEDKAFIQKALKSYQKLKFDNEEIALTLPHLHKSIQQEQLSTIHKLAFFLILKMDTCRNIALFWSKIMDKPFSSVFRTIQYFLAFENLTKTFKSTEMAQKFLGDIYDYVCELQDCNEDTTTFYTVEEDFSVPLTAVIFVCRKEIEFFQS